MREEKMAAREYQTKMGVPLENGTYCLEMDLKRRLLHPINVDERVQVGRANSRGERYR